MRGRYGERERERARAAEIARERGPERVCKRAVKCGRERER